MPVELLAPDDAEVTDSERALRCRACGETLSSERHIFAMDSDEVRQVFVNPHGILREVLTVQDAWGLVFEAWSSTELTWFRGYAWRIAHCAGCGALIGWRFESEGVRTPAAFHGLLSAEIRAASR